MSKFWYLKLVSYSLFYGLDQHLNCSAKPIPIKEGWLKIFVRYGKK